MKWSSLRVRVGLCYAVFTLACLSLFGVFITFYLKRALEDASLPTMQRRVIRLMTYVNHDYPQLSLEDSLSHYLKASPETDEIIVRSDDGNRILFSVGDAPFLVTAAPCIAPPCYREMDNHIHHLRIYTTHAVLAGNPVLLTLAGNIEEHFGIMRTVRTAYFMFVPFLLLASISGGYVLSGRALSPVAKMTAQASRLSITDLRGRITVPKTGDELQNLAEAWNNMLARLDVSVARNAQFTSDASHDLRTSIAVILASAQIALSKVRTPEEHVKLFTTVKTECEHTLSLLEDLLLTARYGFEQHQLQISPLDLAALVRESCLLFVPQAEIKGQSLTLNQCDDLLILGDRDLLHRLITALIDNAIKYTPSGGAISVRLVGIAKQRALLEVSDNGPGIDPADLPHIFDRHFRSQRSFRAERGNGLGLNIARWIADMHHASIIAQSNVANGSTFQVEFPEIEIRIPQAG